MTPIIFWCLNNRDGVKVNGGGGKTEDIETFQVSFVLRQRQKICLKQESDWKRKMLSKPTSDCKRETVL